METARILRGIGVSEETLEAHPQEDWTGLEAELDRFSAYGYGQASQKRWLRTPHPQLAGAQPLEALHEVGGVGRVLEVLRTELAKLQTSI